MQASLWYSCMYRMTTGFNRDISLTFLITFFTCCIELEIDPFFQNIICNGRYSNNCSNLISFVAPFTNDPRIPPPLPVPVPLHNNCHISVSVFVVMLYWVGWLFRTKNEKGKNTSFWYWTRCIGSIAITCFRRGIHCCFLRPGLVRNEWSDRMRHITLPPGFSIIKSSNNNRWMFWFITFGAAFKMGSMSFVWNGLNDFSLSTCQFPNIPTLFIYKFEVCSVDIDRYTMVAKEGENNLFWIKRFFHFLANTIQMCSRSVSLRWTCISRDCI